MELQAVELTSGECLSVLSLILLTWTCPSCFGGEQRNEMPEDRDKGRGEAGCAMAPMVPHSCTFHVTPLTSMGAGTEWDPDLSQRHPAPCQMLSAPHRIRPCREPRLSCSVSD